MSVPTWKKILLRSAGFGAGFAIVVCGVIGGVIWYSSRPSKAVKKWNTTALKVTEPPAFGAYKNDKDSRMYVEFNYSVQNNTDDDYKIESAESLKVLVRFTDGSVSEPVTTEAASVKLPVFLPAKETGALSLVIQQSVPTKTERETDEDYHEQLRSYLEKQWSRDKLAGFVLYDETNRYELNLPRNSPHATQ
jgi:hypothetical protein